MNAYEITFKRLMEKGFIKERESVLSHLGVTILKKEHLNVIIQNLDIGMELKDIKEEVIRMREKLHQVQINVWNTYYILCADEQIVDNENLFFIERDSTGLRKYVVKEEEDINRIPFLDNQPVNRIDNPIKIKDSMSKNDKTIDFLFNFIEENNGAEQIISDEDINEMIDRIV
ncbi:ABC-three component system middle component 1 [Bacillus sp. 196mf]|uniref:ABC-three component system middle component 1 n=1 Tax=Bacillus sp. 196mf TaxID=1761754 RepID=UPI000D7BB63F|nr:ABC-three component system middle component 1 [Bacillus sp. 196mf]PYE89493.1 hypothetical protein ATL10_103457 [Bacillus sp. 196mf]